VSTGGRKPTGSERRGDEGEGPGQGQVDWRRLHPFSPVARVGRLAPALVFLFLVSTVHSKAENARAEVDYLVVITLASAVYGYVHWMVTRWRFEGETLRIETGLIRRDSRRLPLARIQAVDIVRPLLARMLGVSELRIRLAGSGSTDGRLAYLGVGEAAELRLALLARHQQAGSEAAGPATSTDPGLPMASVTLGRLFGSVFLSLVSLILIGTVISLTVLDQFAPRTAAAATGFLAVYMVSFAGVVWRRLSGQYAFVAVEGPEGVRIWRGLLQTVSETVPYGRIQALRQVEPILWRPFGWCRLEVDVAGATARNQRGEGTSVVRKALLPVGSQQDAWHLLARLLGGPEPERTPPPRRARLKAPLSFHFLEAGHDGTHAVCVTGRLNRTTTWVPLEKTQSVRRTQGPLQRPLGLATVHVDVAGRRTRGQLRDRTVEEADRLVDELAACSRNARSQHRLHPAADASGAVPRAAGSAPSGWYPDPSGRYERRYWHDGRWTAHVGDATGRRSADALSSVP
jgi:putative membrane protein